MTRINLVDPATLHSKHLLAEYRELPRIFNLVQLAHVNHGGLPRNRPTEYTLGTGHVVFFYDKLEWLDERFDKLVRECIKRGFKIQHFRTPKICVPQAYWNYWHPRPQDIALSKQRIAEKMPKS